MNSRVVSGPYDIEIDGLNAARDWNRFTAAKNRLASLLGTATQVLDRLACRGDNQVRQRVRQRVAENPGTHTATLRMLARDRNTDVRSAVAHNPNTPQSTVEQLFGDESADVRYSMAEDSNTPELLLKGLADDDNPYVQDRARRTQARIQAQEGHLSGRSTAI